MDAIASGGFLRSFTDLPDPRGDNAIHNLHAILVIALMAIICGADGWVQVQIWGECKQQWLSTFLDLPGGIPSHDTFGRVFSLLDPVAFESCFKRWMSSVVKLSAGRLVAIDGKSIRRSFERGWDRNAMTHLVSAFVSQDENRVVFAQIAVEEKKNEIVAIPKLLELLDLNGAVVTIDAMGCQREIAAQIVAQGGEYILPVKDNQPALNEKVQTLMEDLVLDHAKGDTTCVDYFEQTEQGHGRIETRRVWVSGQIDSLGPDLLGRWTGLGSVILVERTRQDLGDCTGKVSVEQCCYISSLQNPQARTVCGYARGHWCVESTLHWQLDISFNEDQSRIRKGHGAENYSRLSRIALNLIKNNPVAKVGVKSRRLLAGWSEAYLLKLFQK